MTVVPFTRPSDASAWSLAELVELSRLVRLLGRRRGAQGWEIGATERGDPQFYVLGPAPEQACVASVSRIGSTYVLEDGAGRILREERSIGDLVEGATAAFPAARRLPLTARALVALCAGRAFVDEKMVAIEESLEILARVAPQIAVLA